MRIKTIVIILVTVLLTVVIMQNTERIWFKILFFTVPVSKMVMLLFAAIAGFVIGWLAGRPKRKIRLGETSQPTEGASQISNTLSDEDQDYIS